LDNSTFTSLSRFRISDENLITDKLVKASISRAYREGRTFDFYPDQYVIERIAAGDPVEMFRERFFEMTNSILDSFTDIRGSFREKLSGDTRLFIKIINALALFHRGAAECSNKLIATRRVVLVKELPGRPTLHHVSPATTVIAHVGQGPEWAEVPTIYLGLKTFETLNEWKYKHDPRLFEAFRFLLEVEETGHRNRFQPLNCLPT
jgi:hypothetical protein